MINEGDQRLIPTDIGNRDAQIIIESPNDYVVLRQLTPEDAQSYFDLIEFDREHLSQTHESQRQDSTATKYPTIESVQQSIEHPNNPNKYRFGIWDGGKMVGSNNLTLLSSTKAESGSWIGKEHAGNNYAARGRSLLVNFAFNTLGLDELVSEIEIGNIASRKSIEKSGFIYVGDEDGRWIFLLKRT